MLYSILIKNRNPCYNLYNSNLIELNYHRKCDLNVNIFENVTNLNVKSENKMLNLESK